MSDLISRKAVIEAVDKIKIKIEPDVLTEFSLYEVLSYLVSKVETMVRVRIENIPTIEAVPVVHGYVKTVVGKMGVMHQECSVCGNVLDWKAYPNYCDECGAKLDGADMRKKV